MELISKDEVMRLVENGKLLSGSFGERAKDIIKSIPTIEERKEGKWIERDDGWGNVFYECSECGEAFTLIDGTPTDNLYYYCPNCGAKMERRADDTDNK